LAYHENHAISNNLVGERASIVFFTHKNILEIPENATQFDLDPWLLHHIEKQGKKTEYSFDSKLQMTAEQKLVYILNQTELYYEQIAKTKKEIN